jgi:hypothetical protein
MGRQHLALVTVFTLGWLITAAGCSSPTTPGVTVVAAKPASPSNASTFSYYSQPVTLVVTTGVATGGATPTSTVEVATDAAFTTLVTTQAVSAGATGQVTLTLDHLSPATTYYWRVKTAAGNNPGVYSSPASFSIGPLLVIQPPVPVQPLSGSFQHKRPTFIVTNAQRTGPAASLTYRFEVATDPAGSAIVASGSVSEGPNQTSFAPAVDLVPGGSFFWRVQASDVTKNVSSAYSGAQAFTTVNPDDGSFPYTLVLHLPLACRLEYPGAQADLAFDNTLAVTGDRLRFSLYPVGDGPPFLVNADRAGLSLSGTIGGLVGVALGPGSQLFVSTDRRFRLSSYPPPAVFSGSVDAAGRLRGTFDGFVSLDNLAYRVFECQTTGFAWTLAPR